MSKDTAIEIRKPSKAATLMVGAMLGAGAGLVAALLINRRAEREGREAAVTPTEGLKLGLLVFGLLRAISSLGDDD